MPGPLHAAAGIVSAAALLVTAGPSAASTHSDLAAVRAATAHFAM